MKRLALPVAGLLAAIGAGTFWYFTRARVVPTRADPAQLAAVEERSIATSVLATGIIRLRVGAQDRVGAQVSGIVRKLNVGVGAHVEKGKPSPRLILSQPKLSSRNAARKSLRTRSASARPIATLPAGANSSLPACSLGSNWKTSSGLFRRRARSSRNHAATCILPK